jgi:Ca2+-binding RTX toxin-like protein
MVNTPTIWKAQYRLNHTDTGHQFDPDLIDIGMGRYLVVWTESDGPIGTSNGSDLVGQIFDAKGQRVGDEFQINHNFFVDNEQDAALATRPGGGFVMVYEDTDSNGTAIASDTYDVDGHRITSGVPIAIAPDPGGATTISNPAIAMRPDGSYLVTYQSSNGSGDTDIVARTVSTTGTVSGQFTILNEPDNSVDPQAAALTNGNYVLVYQDEVNADTTDHDIRFSIATQAGGIVVDGTLITPDSDDEIQPHVTALVGGGFVAVWTQENGDGGVTGIKARIYDNNGSPHATEFTVNTTTAGDQNEPEVTALPDGGFVVIWDDDEADLERGQRFDANGTKVGSEFIAGSLGNEANPVVATLGDGRFIAGFGVLGVDDIHGTIFDPRGDHIVGTDGKDMLTSRKDGAEVSGKKGSDILLGFNGDDELHGGNGNDQLSGGRGKDMLWGNKGHDKFVFDAALGHGNVDTIEDMKHHKDKIWLDKDIFSAIGNQLGSGEFQKGSHADDSHDYIIYDQHKGRLFYDPDGDGNAGKIKFAKVDPGTKLTHDDFQMIDGLAI